MAQSCLGNCQVVTHVGHAASEFTGETAKDYGKEIPREFEEYLKLKEKEVELLKTVPPKLFPYYKKEVNDYFKRIGNQE